MDVLVMLEQAVEAAPPVAQVNTVPAAVTSERPGREVVTLYGVPTAESLALALAAALEARQPVDGSDAARHLGVWRERGAVGDAAWRDPQTGRLVTTDLEIPFATLRETAARLLDECGGVLRRAIGGLLLADWPEGTRRAISFRLAPSFATVSPAAAESLLAAQREGWGWEWEAEEN